MRRDYIITAVPIYSDHVGQAVSACVKDAENVVHAFCVFFAEHPECKRDCVYTCMPA